jgi:hypothetical protein
MPPAAAPSETAFPDQEHPVFLKEGRGRFAFRLTDQGVRLTQDSLVWTCDEQERRYSFADITTIRLQVVHVHKSGDLGVCQIEFRDRRLLTISGGTAYGFADDEQAQAYAAFIRDLHARLAAARITTIRFLAGNTEGAHTMAAVVMVIGVLFFVGTPLVLLFIIRRWEVLGVLLAGGAFMWPVWRKLEENRPRDYTPGSIPPELVP